MRSLSDALRETQKTGAPRKPLVKLGTNDTLWHVGVLAEEMLKG